MAENFSIADLVPHDPPMVLLDEVVECTEDSITCRLTVRADDLFTIDNQVPAWLGIEYMAQSIAAFSGYLRCQEGLPTRVGFLLGTRRFSTNVAHFPPGQALLVRATRVIQGSNGMAAFECTVEGKGIEQTASLSVYEPGDKEAIDMLGEDQG